MLYVIKFICVESNFYFYSIVEGVQESCPGSIIWTRYFFFLLICNVHCFLEHMILPILCFIWWINLCACCAKESHQKKATILTLKTSKSRRVVPYSKSLHLYSSYQVEGCYKHISPLSRLHASTTSIVSKSKLNCVLILFAALTSNNNRSRRELFALSFPARCTRRPALQPRLVFFQLDDWRGAC